MLISMRLLIIIFLLFLTGFSCKERNLGANSEFSRLQNEQEDFFRINGKYKTIRPFVGLDGKIYQVDTITQWNGEGKPPSMSYKIQVLNQPVRSITSTL